MSTTFFEQLIAVIEAEGERSGETVEISADNSRFLTAPIADAPATPSAAPRATSAAAAPSAAAAARRAPSAALPSSAAPPSAAAVPAAAGLPALDLSGMSMAATAELVRSCARCGLCSGRTQTVFGVGNEDADLMFIGEGPGADEDRLGEPFVGAAGKLLTKIIGAMQMTREQVYFANIVKCRPPGNRAPEPDEAAACQPYLRRQIELVAPRVIVTLGLTPLKYLLGRSGITRTRGQWLKYGEIDCMPTFHPSYLLRVERAKREVWQDMQAVMARLGMPTPDGRQ